MQYVLFVFGVLILGGAVSVLAYLGIQLFQKVYVDYEQQLVAAGDKQFESTYLSRFPAYMVFRVAIAMAVVMGLIGIIFTSVADMPIGARVFATVFLAICGYLVPKRFVLWLNNRRIRKFGDQLVDGLMMVSNCLKSGFSLPQALEMLSSESQPPLSEEFSLVLREYRLGRPLERALSNLLRRVPSQDLDIAVTSILIVREVGGNLATIFDTISETIRERNAIQSKIRALTSQGKLQGIVVGMMPIFLGVAIYFVNPELMKPMLTTYGGVFMLFLIAILETCGALLIRKIVDINI